MSEPLTFIDFLELQGGFERFEFWKTNDHNEFVKDPKGQYIPDCDKAYAFCQELRDRHPDVQVDTSNNIVRVRLLKESLV